MDLTIHELSKLRAGILQEQALISTFNANSPFIRSIASIDLGNNDLYKFIREDTLPESSTRTYNAPFGATKTGSISEHIEGLTILGGEIKVDELMVRNHGDVVRAEMERSFVKSMALKFQNLVVNGDANNAGEFNGMRNKVDPKFVFDAGLQAVPADAPLSLNALSKAIQEVRGATHIAMSPDMKRLISNAAKSDLGGSIRITEDRFGFEVTTYNGLPIVEIDYDQTGNRIVDFDEPGYAGNNNTTSIYVYRSDRFDGLAVLHAGGVHVNDVGLMETEPSYMTRITWQVGLVAKTPSCLARIKGIQNAAVTK